MQVPLCCGFALTARPDVLEAGRPCARAVLLAYYVEDRASVKTLDRSVTVAAMRRLVERYPDRYPAILESSARHPRTGRRTILFAFPGEAIVAGQDRRFFGDLDAAHRRAHGFGHLVFLGYEMLTQIESIDVPDPPGPLPRALALPIAAALVFDHEAGVAEMCGTPDAFEAIREDLASCVDTRPHGSVTALRIDEDDPAAYLRAVRRAKEYIVAGDVFQANIAREWRVTLERDAGPADVYRSLCAANRAPFAGMLRWGDAAILSSSPERLVRAEGSLLESRPIAGTRPRRDGDGGAMIAQLLASEKERAEHVMLLDLVRNDLGRVARFGSVNVDELMVVESYAHVHHIVSNVHCVMKEGVTPGQALAAVFPGGTITGCPKVRCMEIIGELEGVGRGAYTGSLGYIVADGSMDFNILIRTMVWQPGSVRFLAGAGIVADSDPDFELAETRAKAVGLLRALGAW